MMLLVVVAQCEFGCNRFLDFETCGDRTTTLSGTSPETATGARPGSLSLGPRSEGRLSPPPVHLVLRPVGLMRIPGGAAAL